MRSSVLINEPPILVLPTLAAEIGLNEAMVLNQIHYWLNNERIKNHFNGHKWVRNTYDQWGKQFPFWGEKTLRRAFTSLEELQLITSYISSEEFRKTKFYTIQYDNVEKLGLESRPYIKERTPSVSSVSGLASGQNDQIDLVKLASQPSPPPVRGSPSGQNDQTHLVKMTRSYKESETTYRDNILPPPNPPQLKVSEDEEDFEEVGSSSKSSSKPIGQTHSTDWADGSGQNDQMGSRSGISEEIVRPRFKQISQVLPSGQNDQTEVPKGADASGHSGANLSRPSQPKASEEEEENLSQRMIKVWNRLVQGKIKDAPRKELVLTDSRKQALEALFSGILNHDFAEWERYCKQISETRFLLGENISGFKVSLEWALKPDNALKVLEGRIYDKPQGDQGAKQLAPDDFEDELRNHFRENELPQEWLKVYLILANEKGQWFYLSWLKNCRPLPVIDNKAVLQAETRFCRDYMTTSYLSEIKRAAISVWPNLEELTIEVRK